MCVGASVAGASVEEDMMNIEEMRGYWDAGMLG